MLVKELRKRTELAENKTDVEVDGKLRYLIRAIRKSANEGKSYFEATYLDKEEMEFLKQQGLYIKYNTGKFNISWDENDGQNAI